MADVSRELELKLKATGGSQAAAQVREVAKSTDELKDSQSESGVEALGLGDRVAALKKRLEEAKASTEELSGQKSGGGMAALFPTFTKVGQGIKGMGSSLMAMAGGPVGVAVAAITGLVAVVYRLKDEFDGAVQRGKELGEQSAQTAQKLREQARASGEVVTQTERASDAQQDLLDGERQWEEAQERWIAAAEGRNQAADNLAKKLIDLQVAQRTLSEQEAASQKIAIEKAALDRKNGDATFGAAAKVKTASEDLARAKEEEAKAIEAAAAASEPAKKEADAIRAEERAGAARTRAAAVLDPSLSAAGREAAMGGADGFELAANAGIDGPQLDALKKAAEESGRSLAEMLEGLPMLRKKIFEALEVEAAQAGKIAENIGKQADADTAQVEKRKAEAEKELAAQTAIREAAEKRLKAANEALAAAVGQQNIDEQFTKPGLDVSNQTSAAEQISREREAQEKAAAQEALKAAKEDEKTREQSGAAMQPLIDRATEIANSVAASGGLSDQAVAGRLVEALESLADGVDPGEIQALLAAMEEANGLVQSRFQSFSGEMARMRVEIENHGRQIANIR